jgi:EAL domain-containing protein (putative c-di-GMP-specific phosphodiesterase class I)
VKQDGGNGHALFVQKEKRGSRQPLDLEHGLRRALENGELLLHYQPKVSLKSGIVVGAEALVRWNHPELGMVNPAHFIPLAEESGLILPIGEWVLREACRFARSCQEAGLDLEIAVNLSPRQFRHKDLLGVVTGALDASGLEPRRLELEITETAALSRPELAESLLRTLRGLGVQIALDDFGTGHSSLTHLRHLPLDAVKIDRSFVRDIGTNEQDRAIVAGVTTLAHSLGMRITAEGIEDGVQAEAVRRCGCDDYQGYHFSPPLAEAEFRALLGLTRNGQHPMTPAAHQSLAAFA